MTETHDEAEVEEDLFPFDEKQHWGWTKKPDSKDKDSWREALFRNAAAGNANSQLYLANSYYYEVDLNHEGKVAPGDRLKDYELEELKVKMYLLYQMAASQRQLGAIRMLGICRYKGWGCDVDSGIALEYLEDAGRNGDVMAMVMAARIYHYDGGLLKDMDKAKYWYCQGAAQGHKLSQNRLSLSV